MTKTLPRVLIAGTSSGSGKTTAVCAVLTLLKRRGIGVTACKCGPDYIDPMFHESVLGIPSANLDPFFCDENLLRHLLAQSGDELSVIEGVMGYYDGTGTSGTDNNSTFTVAQKTGTPVILVVNAKGASTSLLAVIDGFLNFHPDSRICGVIFNNITAMTYAMLKKQTEKRFGERIRTVGYIPKLPDVKIAGSLVNPEILGYAKADCEIHDSGKMTLEEIVAVIGEAEKSGKTTVRIQSGDPSLYGAIGEQMREFDRLGIEYDITPGVSAFSGAAAALRTEYTLPDVSQTVIITRASGKTVVPEAENLRSLASHGATMVLFLSTGLLAKVTEELIAGGYAPDAPAAIVYKASWPDEKIFRCTVATLEETAKANGITKTALITVGGFLDSDFARSHLYHPDYPTEYREVTK